MFKDAKRITLTAAKLMSEGAQRKSKEIGKPFVFAVVDTGGHLLYLERPEDAYVTSVGIAVDKAFTAATMKRETNMLTERVKPESDLFGLNHTNNGRIVPFGGGIPVIVDGEVTGAVGVSGGAVEEDIAVAEAALEVLKV